MKRLMFISLIIMGVSFTACMQRRAEGIQAKSDSTTVSQTNANMKNLVSIVEIPTTDFLRAVDFYQKALDIEIQTVEMEGMELGILTSADQSPVVQLIHAEGYKTSNDGAIVYLNGGDDLQKVLDRILSNGGKMVVPKTEIGPDMGYYAVFVDTEGNKLGLHSLH